MNREVAAARQEASHSIGAKLTISDRPEPASVRTGLQAATHGQNHRKRSKRRRILHWPGLGRAMCSGNEMELV